MKKIFIVFILSLFLSPLFAQEEAQVQEKTSDPVRYTFSTETLIENQTIGTPYKGGLKLQIQHRFSPIETIHNLYGIYGSANTRIGLNYGITDRLMIGAGTTKDYAFRISAGSILYFSRRRTTVCLSLFPIMATL